LRESDAETILWISGHCVITPDYIRKCEIVMREHENCVVGGRLGIHGHGLIGTLNALVNRSRFGSGAAPSRFETKPGWTAAVTFALYRRADLLAVDALDERMIRNQDTDLWQRMRRNGTRFYRVDAEASYVVTSSLRGLLQKALNNGRWNIWSQKVRRGGLSWWHFTPMAMVGLGAALVAASWGSPTMSYILAFLAFLYMSMAVASSVSAAALIGVKWTIPVLPLLFLLHHVAYGLGSWDALFRAVPTMPNVKLENVGKRT
jgi:hypothetical protein